MNFEEFSYLGGQHAIFSPSNYHWLNYDFDKIEESIHARNRKQLGTEIHATAASEITLRHRQTGIKNIRAVIETYIFNTHCKSGSQSEKKMGYALLDELGYLPSEVFETFKLYVNDAIGFKMSPEVVLAYDPEYFFGTADAISFRDNQLRIHDLKTGAIPAHIEQLEIYAALFCLQNNKTVKLSDIETELRIYQNNDILCVYPTAEDILPIMDKIVSLYKFIKRTNKRGES